MTEFKRSKRSLGGHQAHLNAQRTKALERARKRADKAAKAEQKARELAGKLAALESADPAAQRHVC